MTSLPTSNTEDVPMTDVIKTTVTLNVNGRAIEVEAR
jgi:hypothetical protein